MISATKAMARALLFVLTLLALFGAAGAQAQSNAAFVAQSVPAAMATGTVYNVTVTMKNSGGTTWTSAARYTLGSQGPQDNVTWGGGRVALPTPVAPGGQASFAFQLTAPTTPGSYNFQWRMLQEGVAWFGALSPKVAVTVSAVAPRNDAQLIGVSVPAEMKQGQSYSVAVTMKNVGNTTWTAGSAYKLGSANPHDNMVWSLKRVALGSNVVPGQRATFSFPVMAPAAGGYTMSWQMVQEGVAWFGAASNSPVTVSAASPAPTMSVTRSPAPMTAGQPFSLTWRSTNATSVKRACTASGSGYTVNDAPALNGSATGTASAAWVNYPSTCTWTASGSAGSAAFRETMVTNAAATGEVVTYIHTDGLGSPVARTDAAGHLVSRTRYEPYGLTAGGATPTIGFTGHVNDADTGLVYMQQRYYDPVAGRFMSIDPVMADANTGSSFNRYVYANNSPYKYIDPDGRNIVDAAFLAVDLYRLGSAVVAGEGIGAALVDVGISALGVASPVPFVGQGIKSVRAAEHVAQAVKTAEKGASKYVEGGKFSKNTKDLAAERAGRNCEYCGTKTEKAEKSQKGVTPPKNEGQTDHINPASKGGTNAPENAAHACRECNRGFSDAPKPSPRDPQ